MRSIQYIPRATEKAYNASTKDTYVFYAPLKASKQEIAQQISAAFNVTVIDVRTIVRKGKPTRFNRGKRAYPGTTTKQDKKVAYITVKAGDKIPVFEDSKDQKKADDAKAKETKEDKKAAKKVEKAKDVATKPKKEDK